MYQTIVLAFQRYLAISNPIEYYMDNSVAALGKYKVQSTLGRPKYVTVLPDSKFEVSRNEFQIYLPKKSLKKIFKKKFWFLTLPLSP